MGYDPNFFGPPSWHILHTLSAHIIILQSQGVNIKPYMAAFKNIAESLKKITPCENCRKNYIINCRVIKIDQYSSSPMNMFKWTVDLHNLVNGETQKPMYGFNKALKTYHVAPINQRYWCDPKNFENEMWKMIHCLAGNLVMKEEERKQDVSLLIREYVKFINNLAILIPCNNFRALFKESLTVYPLKPNMKHGRDVFNWSVNVHNYMNKHTNKQPIRLEQACKTYGLVPEK